MNVEERTDNSIPSTLSITSVPDLWLLSCLYEFASDTEKYLDRGEFHLYGESIRKFFYQQLCDIYIVSLDYFYPVFEILNCVLTF